MLHDEADILVYSGKGGDGCCSFRRESKVPEGGPDGGDGGKGGDIILRTTIHLNSLTPFIRRRHWRADKGRPGAPRSCTGAAGKDLIIEVPLGTIVRHRDTGELLADLTGKDQSVIIAAGGRGGRGNERFKTSTRQTPRKITLGGPSIEVPLHLELKLIADVGFLGYPNAGKSTLLSRYSAAHPKIAAYPFTTLEPQLGVVVRGEHTLVLADIPGILEGAAEGFGLGHRFLRHIERCSLLLHLVDGSEGDIDALVERIRILNGELSRFSERLAAKPQIVALNKADTRPDLIDLRDAVAARLGTEVHVISGVSGQGLERLLQRLLQRVADAVEC